MTRSCPPTSPRDWGSTWLKPRKGNPGQSGDYPSPTTTPRCRLRLCDGYEECEWDAIVGFVAAPMRWAILGQAGALQYFDLQLLGSRREALIAPNATFPGRHVIHRSPPP